MIAEQIEVKGRPILFSAPLVLAILEGRKTQTRRIIKPRRSDHGFVMTSSVSRDPLTRWPMGIDEHEAHTEYLRCPYGNPGDQIYVREAFYVLPWIWKNRRDPQPIHYAADVKPEQVEDYVKKPSIHMPKWASRIQLEVTGVRVERVQDITEDDAKAEGVEPFPNDPEGDCWTDGTHRTAFEYLWNEIHGWHPNAWQKNPWVWVVEFKRI